MYYQQKLESMCKRHFTILAGWVGGTLFSKYTVKRKLMGAASVKMWQERIKKIYIYFEPQSCCLFFGLSSNLWQTEKYYFTLFGQLFKRNHMENFGVESNTLTSVTKDPIYIQLFFERLEPKWLRTTDLIFNKKNVIYNILCIMFIFCQVILKHEQLLYLEVERMIQSPTQAIRVQKYPWKRYWTPNCSWSNTHWCVDVCVNGYHTLNYEKCFKVLWGVERLD